MLFKIIFSNAFLQLFKNGADYKAWIAKKRREPFNSFLEVSNVERSSTSGSWRTELNDHEVAEYGYWFKDVSERQKDTIYNLLASWTSVQRKSFHDNWYRMPAAQHNLFIDTIKTGSRNYVHGELPVDLLVELVARNRHRKML